MKRKTNKIIHVIDEQTASDALVKFRHELGSSIDIEKMAKIIIDQVWE